MDGVFVPNGKTPQTISSRGHIFEACPETQGNYYTEIAYCPQFRVLDAELAASLSREPSLLLHANLGITFDLDAVRSRLTRINITAFKAQLDISTLAPRIPHADTWVLVDGQLRYSKQNMTEIGKREAIHIPLRPEDRFLTLVATDGGDSDNRFSEDGSRWKSIDSDWCVFWNPVLVLE